MGFPLGEGFSMLVIVMQTRPAGFCSWNVQRLYLSFYVFDVRGSMYHSKIHKEKSNKMQKYIQILYSIFLWSSTCFGRHIAHHQEPKTALAASRFSYVEGCSDVQLDVVRHSVPDSVHQLQVRTTFHVWKTRGCQCSFKLLMMGGVSPETCWAS